jgi:hypothetical protein
MHIGIPEYQINKVLWIHKMYFSTISLKYIHMTGIIPQIFQLPFVSPNALDVKNICIPLPLMEKECRNIIQSQACNLDMIQNNNLLLMLLSDFRDIVLQLRVKEYSYSL